MCVYVNDYFIIKTPFFSQGISLKYFLKNATIYNSRNKRFIFMI